MQSRWLLALAPVLLACPGNSAAPTATPADARAQGGSVELPSAPGAAESLTAVDRVAALPPSSALVGSTDESFARETESVDVNIGFFRVDLGDARLSESANAAIREDVLRDYIDGDLSGTEGLIEYQCQVHLVSRHAISYACGGCDCRMEVDENGEPVGGGPVADGWTRTLVLTESGFDTLELDDFIYAAGRDANSVFATAVETSMQQDGASAQEIAEVLGLVPGLWDDGLSEAPPWVLEAEGFRLLEPGFFSGDCDDPCPGGFLDYRDLAKLMPDDRLVAQLLAETEPQRAPPAGVAGDACSEYMEVQLQKAEAKFTYFCDAEPPTLSEGECSAMFDEIDEDLYLASCEEEE